MSSGSRTAPSERSHYVSTLSSILPPPLTLPPPDELLLVVGSRRGGPRAPRSQRRGPYVFPTAAVPSLGEPNLESPGFDGPSVSALELK